jgi:hypothetical protein
MTVCGVPADLKAKTKPEIELELLIHAIERQSLPFQWAAACAFKLSGR